MGCCGLAGRHNDRSDGLIANYVVSRIVAILWRYISTFFSYRLLATLVTSVVPTIGPPKGPLLLTQFYKQKFPFKNQSLSL